MIINWGTFYNFGRLAVNFEEKSFIELALFRLFSLRQVAPKYTPEIYEDAGKALATSILDLTESNPWTRLTCSAFKNLRGVREWLRKYIRAAKSAENEANAEREGRRSRLGRRRNSESSVKMGHHSKLSPMKAE